MNVLKRHFEKVILGAVLVFLLAAVIVLPFKITREQENLANLRGTIMRIPPKPLPPLDLSRGEQALARVQRGVSVALAAPPHNLFSPVTWRRYPDGRREKVERAVEGPAAVEVLKIVPLYMTVSFDSVDATGTNYLVVVNNEAEFSRSRRRIAKYVSVGDKTDLFVVREVVGPIENPTKLVLELQDTGEVITISTNEPYRRVSGFMADLRYDPEKRVWPNRRVGSVIGFAGEEFVVSAINQVATNEYEIVLSARLSGKKHIIRYRLTQ